MDGAQRAQNSYFWMFLGIAGILFFVNFTVPNFLLQMNSVDPYIYTSYAHNYADLIERYGRTYFSCRLAFIYPARFFIWIFGSEAGYLVFRNILLFGTISALWRICLRFYDSKRIAAFVSFFVVLHPWFLRSILWDHIDGVAIVYILLSISFFIFPQGRDRTSYFLSGIFFLLAVNCHAFVAAIFIAFLPFWVMQLRHSPTLNLFAKNISFFFVGLASMYLFLIGITYWEFPSMNPFFDASTYKMSKWMLKGGGLNWMSSISSHISQGGSYIFYPVFVLILCALTRILPRKKQLQHPRFGFLAILCLFLTLCIYLFVQFVLKVNVICYFYYFSYAIPSALVALIWLTGESFCFIESKNKILGVSVVLYALIWLFCPHWMKHFNKLSGEILAIAAISFLILYTIFALLNCARIKACFVACALILSPILFYRSGTYSSIHAVHSPKKEWDLYHGSVHLQNLISKQLDPRSGKVGFWYSNKAEQEYLNSAQSMYLWAYSRLTSLDRSATGMPIIDQFFRERINNYRYLVLLAPSENEIEEGCKSLSNEGIQTTEVIRSTYHSGEINYHLLVLEKTPKS